MLPYILRRVWQMIPTLLGVILLIFFLFKYFGGDPAEVMAGLKASPERIASLRAQLAAARAEAQTAAEEAETQLAAAREEAEAQVQAAHTELTAARAEAGAARAA